MSLNPGYKVIARREKMETKPALTFVCTHCHKPCLEVDLEPGAFRTRCSSCRRWVYGEKIVIPR
jgi:hypothetical protein